MSISDYIYRTVTYGILSVLLVYLAYVIVQENWDHVFVIGQAVVLSLVPGVLQKRYDIHTPVSLQAGIVLFMFATLFLGEVRQFYNEIWWWDIPLHMVAGAGLTIISFILLVIFFRARDLRQSAFLTTLFAFSFGVGLSALWEVYEFMIDAMFATENLMQPNNSDTMIDIIAGITGSLVIAVFGYAYVRFRYKGFIADIIDEGRAGNLQHNRNHAEEKKGRKFRQKLT